MLGGNFLKPPSAFLGKDRVGDSSAWGNFLKPPSALEMIVFGNIDFIAVERLHELPVMSNRLRLRVEQSQVCDIPWIAYILVRLWVLQPVGAASDDF